MKLSLAVLLQSTRLHLDLSSGLEPDFFFAVMHPKQLKARFEKV